jgi:hypothetical protein
VTITIWWFGKGWWGRIAKDLAGIIFTVVDPAFELECDSIHARTAYAQGIPTVVVVVVERCLCTGAGAAALVVVVVEEVSAGTVTPGMVPLSLVV